VHQNLCIIVKIFGTPFYVVLTSEYDKGQNYLIKKDLIGWNVLWGSILNWLYLIMI